MQSNASVVLVALDGEEFRITPEGAQLMDLVASMLEEEEGEVGPIPLPGIQAKQLATVVDFCEHEQGEGRMPEIPTQMTWRTQLLSFLPVYHIDFIDNVDLFGLAEWVKLGRAARYLGVRPLVQLVHARVREATLNKDGTTICRMLGVTGNIPSDMLEQVDALCAWDIEDFQVIEKEGKQRPLGRYLVAAAAKTPSEPSVITLLLDCFKGQDPAGDYQVTHEKEKLWVACCAGYETRVCELLAQGADPNGIVAGMPQGAGMPPSTPLCCAVRRRFVGITRRLLAAGADPNAGRRGAGIEDYYYPMLFACRNGDLQTIRILIEHGADVKSNIMNGAIAAGRTEVVRVFLEEGAKEITPSVVEMALTYGQDDILNMFLEQGVPDIAHLLRLSVHFEKPAMVKFALEMGGKPNEYHCCTGYKRSLLSCALVNESSFDIALLLLEAGANPNQPSCITNVDHVDQPSGTPLRDALSHMVPFEPNNKIRNMVRTLLRKGANANVPTASGIYPLQRAISYMDFETCRLLLYHGADPNIRIGGGLGVLASSVEQWLTTPLFNTCDPEILRLLLHHGADPSITNGEGQTAAMAFALEGRDSLSQLLLEAEAVFH